MSNDALQQEAISLAVEIASDLVREGVTRYAGRRLRAEEEAELLADLRKRAAARTFRTNAEILKDAGLPTVEELERGAVKNPAAKDTPDEES